MSLFQPAVQRAVDANGDTLSGALWRFYESGTTTPADVYTSNSLETPHANPVVADSGGKFPGIFLDDAVLYRAVLETSIGVPIQDLDPVNGAAARIKGNILSYQANTVPGVTDFADALEEAIADITVSDENFGLEGAGKIVFPAGVYYFSRTIQIKKTLILEGAASATNLIPSTLFKFPANTAGIIVDWEKTEMGSAVAENGNSGSGTIIRNIGLLGSGTTFDATKSGIWAKARVHIEDCHIQEFAGHNIWIRATIGGGGVAEGEASCSTIRRNRLNAARGSGLCIQGADANICHISENDAVGNHAWGFEDLSFLGNVYTANHTRDNGNDPARGGFAWVNHAGKHWYLVTQSTTGSTTEPGTNNNVWREKTNNFHGTPGTANDLIPNWVSGMAVREGGAYLCFSSAASGNLLSGCYSEGSQPPSQIVRGLVVHGTHGAGVEGGAWIYDEDGRLRASNGYRISGKLGITGADVTGDFGGGLSNGDLMRWSHPTEFPNFFRLQYNGAGRMEWLSGGVISHGLTVNDTAYSFGRSAPVRGAFYAPQIFLGDGDSARAVTFGPAAPTTGAHGKHDIVFNNGDNPAHDAVDYWRCTVAGTPGTWVARP